LMEAAPRQVAASLVGPAGAGAAAARLRRALLPLVPAEVALSLLLRDDDDAWALREELFASAPHGVIASLETAGSAQAWELRERFLAQRGGERALASYDDADTLCRSITGLDDERAWEVRELAYRTTPVCALESLEGASSERAHGWRQRHVERAPKPVMKSLYGVDDDHAWALREQVAETCKEAIGSIYGLDTPRAWALRERYRDLWPSTVAGSLGPELARTPRGTELVESLLAAHGGLAMWRAAAAVASEAAT
jgi:dTMP kinase